MFRGFSQFGLALGVSAIVGLAATACGSSQPAPAGGAPAGGPSAQPAPAGGAPAAPAAGKPVYGGTFRIANTAWAHLDPQRINSGGEYVFGTVYDGLVTFKDQTDYNEYIVVPQLAEKWDISADGKTYTFKLRAGVKFHNGDAMTADDVVYSLDRFRAKEPEATRSYYLEAVDKVEKVDDLTVKLTLREPFAPLISYLAQPYPSIVHRKTVEANNGSLKQTMMGTGPFKFVSFETGNRWVGEKNPDFWGKDADGNKLPYLDKFEYIIMPDYAARTAAFRARETEVYDWYRGPDVLNIPKSNPDSTQLKWTGQLAMPFAFNVAKKPFDDVRVRRAFALAMDKRGIAKSVNVIGPGYLNQPLRGSVGKKWSRPYDNDALEKDLPYFKQDVVQAKALLKEAGYENGLKVSATIRRDLLNNVTGMEIYRENMKEVGVDLEIKGLEVGAHARALVTRDFDVVGTPQGTPTADPDDALYGSFFSGASQNYFGIGDKKLDELILKQRRALNDDERLKTLREIEVHLTDQAYWLFGTDADYASSWQPWVKNFKRTFSYHVLVRHAWIDKK